MDRNQLASIQEPTKPIEASSKIHIDMHDVVVDETPRTLLYGYDCDRNTWHLYGEDTGEIILYIYSHGSNDIREVINVTEDGIKSLEDLVPNKRLYPQYCDFEFSGYLKVQGVHLPFTTYAEPDETRWPYAGEVA